MKVPKNYSPLSCRECANGAGLNFDFTMAFQPIVDSSAKTVFAHEALVRGVNNEPAGYILSRVNERNRYRFDQACRVKAISLAAGLDLRTCLSINFLPGAVYRPETCIRTTLEAARSYKFPADRIIFEVTEGAKVTDHAHIVPIFQEYKRLGFMTAIDDFGAGFSGLNLLAEFQPDIIKLDMTLIRGIHEDKARRAIVDGILAICREISCQVIAEGIENREEMIALDDIGVHLFQGYYFAKPAFQSLSAPSLAAFVEH